MRTARSMTSCKSYFLAMSIALDSSASRAAAASLRLAEEPLGAVKEPRKELENS